MGLVLVVLCANFYRVLDLSRHGGMLAMLFGGVWLAGAGFVALEPGRERERLGRLVTYGATLGLCLLFLALYDRWSHASGTIGDATDAPALPLSRARHQGRLWVRPADHIGLHALVAYLRENHDGLPVARPPVVRVLIEALLRRRRAVDRIDEPAGSRADTLAKLGMASSAPGAGKRRRPSTKSPCACGQEDTR